LEAAQNAAVAVSIKLKAKPVFMDPTHIAGNTDQPLNPKEKRN